MNINSIKKYILRNTVWKSRLLSKLFYISEIYFRHRVLNYSRPLIVYTMGKTGTKSIYNSLLTANLRRPLFYLHCLSREGTFFANRLSMTSAHSAPVKNYWVSLYLNKIISGNSNISFDLISCVRDPIAVNISGFFQTIEHWIPNFNSMLRNKSIDIQDMVKIFFDQYPHNFPLNWFDNEVRNIFDVDVYDSNYNHDTGYQSIQNNKAHMVIFRLDKLEKFCAVGLQKELNLHNIKLSKHNISKNKSYGKIYNSFLDTIQIPEDYLNMMYKSKMAKHFYSSEELDTLKQNWKNRR